MKKPQFFLLLLALGVTLAGTQVVKDPARTGTGVSLLILGLCLGLIASSGEKPPAFARSLPITPSVWKRILGFSLLLTSAIAALGMIKLFESTQSPLPWLFYMLSLVYLGFAFYLLEERPPSSPARSETRGLLLPLILLLAFFLRLYRIDRMPPGIYYDEACNALDAAWAVDSGTYPPYFEACNGRGPLLIYSLAPAIKLLGNESLALRIVPVFYGTATVLAFYLLLRLIDARLAIIGALLLGIMRWHFHFSRVVFDAITTPFFATFSLYFLWRGFLRGARTDFLLAGFMAGWGLMGYAAFRVFPLLALLSFLPYLIKNKARIREVTTAFLIFLLAILLASAPLISYAIHHPDTFLHRSRQVYLLRFHPLPAGVEALKHNLRVTLLMFHQRGDFNPRHNLPDAPLLDPIMGALTVVGIGICLRKSLDWRYGIMPLWLILFLQPGIWSIEAPQALRNIGAVIPVAFMGAVALREIASAAPFLSRGLILPLVMVSLTLNFHLYFFRHASDPRVFYAFHGLETTVGRVISSLGSAYRFYSIYATDPTVHFLLPREIDLRFLDSLEHIPLRERSDRDIVYLVDPRYDLPLEVFLHWYPGAEVKEIPDPSGKTMLRLIVVGKEEVNSSVGLRVLPQETLKEGSFFIPETGVYRLKLEGSTSAELLVAGADGFLTLKGGEEVSVHLIKGWHDFKLRGPGRAEIHGGGLDGQVPEELFNIHPAPKRGLTGYYYRGTDWSGEPVFARVDPFIAFRWHIQPLPAPFCVEWRGFLKVEKPGYYGFALFSNSPSFLEIDGQLVVRTSHERLQEGRIYLSEGEHKIRVRYQEPGGYSAVYLYWKPPGGELEIPPPEIFTPLWGTLWNEW
ncbi:MAG: PA14 domain-containing protein [Anaerolineae bacterium]|nr:PA14 domain-containing protein [Anaerolineae bacterium]MDW8103236.1 PA14 domain-containing protein [Anaerolineae bacterium]